MKKMISQISNNSNSISPEKIADTLRNNFVNIASKMDDNVSMPPIQTPTMSVPNVNNTAPDIVEKTGNFLSPWFLFKIILALTIIGILGFNIYTYVTHGVDAITFYFNDEHDSGDSSKKNELELDNVITKSGEDDTALDLAAEKYAKSNKKNRSDLEDVMEKKETYKPKKNDEEEEIEQEIVNEIEKKNKNYSANNVSVNAKSKLDIVL